MAFLAMPVVLAAELKVGDDAPTWKGIVGIDDKEHALADYKDAKLIVLVFITNHCPVAKAYEDRLIAVQNDYQGKGVQLIAVLATFSSWISSGRSPMSVRWMTT